MRFMISKSKNSHAFSKEIAALTLVSVACFSTSCTKSSFAIQEQNQSFGQQVSINSQVDVMIVTSTTSSMSTKNRQLGSSFGTFIDYMLTSQFDFHIAVTTMDMSGSGQRGRFVGNPAVLTRGTPNVKQAFINNMNLGTAGSDLPRGLEAMSTALSPAMLSGANSGFLRSGALLAVLFLADQDDVSGGNITDYVDFLSSVKPPFPYGYKGWVASSFVVQSLSAECRTFNSFASVGMRFLDLTNQSSGVSESICSGDLTQATASLQSRIASMLTQFTLGRAADPQSIKVFINGVQIPQDPGNGWTYVPTGYLIVFHGASIPPANAQISVKFNPTTIGH